MPEPSRGANEPSAAEPSDDEIVQSRLYATVVVTIYLGTFVLLWFPALFLASGIQAIGRERGWWAGDYMANDGEETTSTAIGLFGTGFVLVVAASLTLIAALLLERRTGSTVRAILIGSSVVVAGQAVIWTVLLTN